jgi:recombinational DNA repair protein (RecF pathway)
VPVLLGRAELSMLRILGHAPSLSRCAECREQLAAEARTAFGMLDGGVLCGRCRRGRRAVISVSPPAMAVLRTLADERVPCRAVDLPAAVGGEVRGIMNTLLAHLLGRPLRVPTQTRGRRRTT